MNDEFLGEFIAESQQHIVTAEELLLRMQPGRLSVDDINAAFRALHTIKGGAGFLDQLRIQRLAHAAEQVLDALRAGKMPPTRPVLDALLGTLSLLNQGLEVAAGASAPELEALEIAQIELLDRLGQPEASAGPSARAAAPSRPLEAWVGELLSLDPADGASLQRCLLGVIAASRAAPPAEPANAAEQAALLQQITLLTERVATGCDEARFQRLLALVDDLARLHQTSVEDDPLDAVAASQALVASSPAVQPTAPAAGSSSLLDYITESLDLLADAERICLGQGVPDADGIHAVFRAFHTIKGMSGYLGQPAIEAQAHAIENRLLPLRDREREFIDTDRQSILDAIDQVRAALAALKEAPTQVDDGELGDRIGDLLVAQGVDRTVVEQTARHLAMGQRLGEVLVAEGKATPAQVDQAVAVQAAVRSGGDGFSRVATAKLEELMNQVGELLICQAQIQHDPELTAGSHLAQEINRQSRIIRELQDLALSLRLVPLKSTFQKLTRAVHDTARKVQKEIEFVVVGDDTEVDRSLAETIADPLLHMVRNGVDHGIEGAAARTASGKPERGMLRLSACHSGDHVVITLADDGAGMDPDRLRRKAVDKGLIPADRALSDTEAFELIFLPGFSTAAAVTAVSGRGVGMDVVRRAVEAANGSVGIASVLGQGTTFTVRLPLTTAILDAMLLRCGDCRFLLPIRAIVEAVRPAPGAVQSILGGGSVIQSRGRSLPILALGHSFAIAGAQEDPLQAILVVVDDGGQGLALLVDEILGQQQIVIKPLSPRLPHHPAISGSTILGDGRVGLILDPTRLT